MSVSRLMQMAASGAGGKTWDLAYASYDGVSFDVSPQDNFTSGVSFKTDGTKMYVVGSGGQEVNEYNLSTAWDVSSASYQSTKSLGSVFAAYGIYFRPDGTMFFVVIFESDRVEKYVLGTPWNITTASKSGEYSVTSQDSNPAGVFLKPDGTKMYVTGTGNDRIYEYDLSTAWTLGDSVSFTQQFSVQGEELNPRGLHFKDDGSKVFLAGSSGQDINEYALNTPWDISTASYTQNFSVSSQGTAPFDLYISPDGDKMFTVDASALRVFQYSIG